MNSRVSISIDVADLDRAVTFYTQALGCSEKTKFSDQWQVLILDGLDIHLQEKEPGSNATAHQQRDYDRHWTPIHLDFGVADIKQAASLVDLHGGTTESMSFSEVADIALCADPFGNGFCLIRE